MVDSVEKYGRGAVVGVHAALLLSSLPQHGFYAARKLLHYRRALDRDAFVHILGTGTAAFHTSLLPELTVRNASQTFTLQLVMPRRRSLCSSLSFSLMFSLTLCLAAARADWTCRLCCMFFVAFCVVALSLSLISIYFFMVTAPFFRVTWPCRRLLRSARRRTQYSVGGGAQTSALAC
jgi:hypothetical protein